MEQTQAEKELGNEIKKLRKIYNRSPSKELNKELTEKCQTYLMAHNKKMMESIGVW